MNRRKMRLADPRQQLRTIAVVLAVAVVAILFQAALTGYTLTRAAVDLPSEGPLILEQLPRMLAIDVACTTAVLAPLMLVVAGFVTSRIAGPLRGFERFFTALANGENPDRCRIGDGDELQDLCALINRATERLRAENDTRVEAPIEALLEAGWEAPTELIAEPRPEPSSISRAEKTRETVSV